MAADFEEALKDGRAYVVPTAPAAPAEPSVKLAEPRVSKQTFAAQVGMSVRWVEERIVDGLPCIYVAERARLRVGEGEAWLRANGYLKATPPAQRGGRKAATNG